MKKSTTLRFFRKSYRPLFGILALALVIAACSPLISAYDGDTFKDTTELKAKTLVLMDRAVEPYDNYKTQVDEVMVMAGSLYDRQKVRRYNKLTVKQWDLLLSDDALPGTKAMLPPFFENWKSDGKLKPFYIKEIKKQIAAAFDEIIKLESAKIKNVGQ